MKKLEQAIAYFEDAFEDAIKESDEIIAECSEKLQLEFEGRSGKFREAFWPEELTEV